MKELTLIKTDNEGYIISSKDRTACYQLKNERDAPLKLACRLLWQLVSLLDIEDVSEEKQVMIAVVGKNYVIPKDA